MRRFDKKAMAAVNKANQLAEQRHIASRSLISESEMWGRDAAHRDTYQDTSHIDNWEKGGGPEEEDYSEFVDRDYRLIPQNGGFILWDNDNDYEHENWKFAKDAYYDEETGRNMDSGPQYPVTNPNTGEVENVIVWKPTSHGREDFGGM